MEEGIKPSDWINARDMYRPKMRLKEPPKIDKEVSEIVGMPIAVNDPRLVKAVIHWRESAHPDKPDNHLQSQSKREDLKKIFNEKLYR